MYFKCSKLKHKQICYNTQICNLQIYNQYLKNIINNIHIENREIDNSLKRLKHYLTQMCAK